MTSKLNAYEHAVAGAVIAVDTLWGGDVSCRSGTGRVIADSYFSGKDLPDCYHGAEAERLRASGGVSAKTPDKPSVLAYLRRWTPQDYILQMRKHAEGFEPRRRAVVEGLAAALEMQLHLALEAVGEGPVLDYDHCVRVAMGTVAREADTQMQLQQVRELLGQLGHAPGSGAEGLLDAVDSYRAAHWVGHEGLQKAGARVLSELEELTRKNFVAYLPDDFRVVPRSNVLMIPIKEAWFSGSMNYLGRNRTAGGEPEYEAEYEINEKIEKSQAEFVHLVAHEVIPGHVTTFAMLQNLYYRGKLGFEATILTMNTRHSALFEGIANTALLFAHGVTRIEELPDPTLRLGMLLAELEDAAKNNASYLTWAEKLPSDATKRRLREECLVTRERADKLTDSWAKHALMGRAYMPSYLHGTRVVRGLVERHGLAKTIPVLYGTQGLCDCVTVEHVVN